MEHKSRSLARGRGQVVWWGASRLCDSIGSAPTGRQHAVFRSRGRDRRAAPKLAPRLRIVRQDHARGRAALGLAAAPRDDFTVRDDRARRLLGAMPIVEQLRLPLQLAAARVERVEIVVGARIDDRIAEDREVPIDGRHRKIFAEIRGQRAPVLPKQIAARRVDRLNEIARIGEVHHAAVDERRALLNAGPRARVQTIRKAPTFLPFTSVRGLKPQVSSVRLHISQSAGSGFWSTRSVTGTNSACGCAITALATKRTARTSVR